MSKLSITIGNKNYSSWSLRGWLAVKLTGAAFEEEVVPLDLPESKKRLRAAGPSGQVPVLKDGALTVWDSLAIGEYLADRFPESGLWPSNIGARAVARAVTCEMHAGFAALREHMPMDLRSRYPGYGRGPGVAEDIARVLAIWEDCRARFGQGGDYLFGDFCLADAAFAPVVTRFVTYEVALAGPAAAYRDAVLAWPAIQEWTVAARDEPWVIAFPGLQAPGASAR